MKLTDAELRAIAQSYQDGPYSHMNGLIRSLATDLLDTRQEVAEQTKRAERDEAELAQMVMAFKAANQRLHELSNAVELRAALEAADEALEGSDPDSYRASALCTKVRAALGPYDQVTSLDYGNLAMSDIPVTRESVKRAAATEAWIGRARRAESEVAYLKALLKRVRAALGPEEAPEAPEQCSHEAWEETPSGLRKCADCGESIPKHCVCGHEKRNHGVATGACLYEGCACRAFTEVK